LIITQSSFCKSVNWKNHLSPAPNKLQATIHAMADVVETFFIQQNITHFDYLILNESNKETFELISGIQARTSSHSCNIKLINSFQTIYNLSPVNIFKINNSAVIVCNRMCFSSHYVDINLFKADNIKFLIYMNGSMDTIWETFEFRSFIMNYEFVILETEKDIQILTDDIYVNGQCRNTYIDHYSSKNKKHYLESYFQINSFKIETLSWANKLEFFEKYQDFYKCGYIITCKMDFSHSFGKYKNLHDQIIDLYFELIHILADVKNFSKLIVDEDLFYVDRPGFFDLKLDGYFRQDGLSFEKILPLKFDPNSFQTQSTFKPIENDEIFLIVTPGESYTDYEKLMLPFDAVTWKYLLITFGCAFLLIFGINLMPRQFQDLVYGENVQSPAYNVVGNFRILIKYYFV
jgi:hypothetical protein